MQLTTKSRYAIRAMMELASHKEQSPLLLKEIAQRQDISEKYLEQLMAPLRASKLIYTMRGKKGGYMLGRDPRQITLYEIINVVEGSLAPVPCVDHVEICNRAKICAAREVWVRLQKMISQELRSINLAELAARQEQKLDELGIKKNH